MLTKKLHGESRDAQRGQSSMREVVGRSSEVVTCGRTLKELLAAQLGVSRFRQRLLRDQSVELVDATPAATVATLVPPATLQLLILDFQVADAETTDVFIDACEHNELSKVWEFQSKSFSFLFFPSSSSFFPSSEECSGGPNKTPLTSLPPHLPYVSCSKGQQPTNETPASTLIWVVYRFRCPTTSQHPIPELP